MGFDQENIPRALPGHKYFNYSNFCMIPDTAD